MSTQEGARPGGCRVMVVDDHHASAQMLAEILSLEGYTPALAHSGDQAVSMARKFDPRVALIDVALPDMDGFEVARRLKADPGLRRIRLIALSGYAESGFSEGSKAAGFEEYLVKPVDVDALLALLARLA